MSTGSERFTKTEKIAICAEGENAMQAALHENLRSPWVIDGDIARTGATVPHRFLFGGISLSPKADPGILQSVDGEICDSFATFNAAQLPSREASQGYLWMYRAPADVPVQDAQIQGLSITRVVTAEDLARWEAASFVANGDAPEKTGGSCIRRVHSTMHGSRSCRPKSRAPSSEQ